MTVIRLYTLLGHYVEAACNNDPAAFNTGGFTVVVKTRTAPQPLAPAKFFDVHYALEGTGGVPGHAQRHCGCREEHKKENTK